MSWYMTGRISCTDESKTSLNLHKERPPLPPPSLLDGFPDPQRVDARLQRVVE